MSGTAAIVGRLMLPQIFPLNRRRRTARAKIIPIADEGERERLLLRRIAQLPLARAQDCRAPDAGLVALAAALLEADVRFGSAFGGACCGASAQRLLLAAYTAEGQDCDLSLISLQTSGAFDAPTVALRWVLKLLADGMLELVAGADGGRALRLAPQARVELDAWLARTRKGLSSLTRDFAV